MTQSYHPSTSAHRRRTDLMPTITFNNASPGGTISGSGLSRSSTPGTRMLRSPGKAQSMSRLDILSKPRLKLHASAAHQNTPALSLSSSSAHKRQVPKTTSSPPSTASSGRRKMSQSMSHLAHLSPAKKSPTGNGNHRTGGPNKGKFLFKKYNTKMSVLVMVPSLSPIHICACMKKELTQNILVTAICKNFVKSLFTKKKFFMKSDFMKFFQKSEYLWLCSRYHVSSIVLSLFTILCFCCKQIHLFLLYYLCIYTFIYSPYNTEFL